MKCKVAWKWLLHAGDLSPLYEYRGLLGPYDRRCRAAPRACRLHDLRTSSPPASTCFRRAAAPPSSQGVPARTLKRLRSSLLRSLSRVLDRSAGFSMVCVIHACCSACVAVSRRLGSTSNSR